LPLISGGQGESRAADHFTRQLRAEFLQVLCVPVQTPPGQPAFVWLPKLTLISGNGGLSQLQQFPDAMQTAAELPALCSAETTNR
jgi:hypothetical protein